MVPQDLDQHITATSPALDSTARESAADEPGKSTLGHVRLRNRDTDALILIPTPSSDPNDPLNWPQWRKFYTAGLLCLAMAVSNFLAAGPTIAIVDTALDFFPGAVDDGSLSTSAVPKVSYFFTTSALLQGMGNLLWTPMANKWGRRPVYLFSYLIYFVASIWLIFEDTYVGFLAARIIMGFGAGAAETIAPISIADVFFLHERGTVMAAYTCFLSIGVAGGVVISGLVTIDHSWRAIYELGAGLVGFILLLAFFTFPETAFFRGRDDSNQVLTSHEASKSQSASTYAAETDTTSAKKSLVQSLKVFHGTMTREPLAKMILRPFGLIVVPPVFWAALVQAATIGFLVAVTSNEAVAFEEAYGFEAYQAGLCFVAAIIGSLVGVPAGGQMGDWVADVLTKRNGGVREPEMRLPAMALSMVTAPLSLILYGVGIERGLHWMCPTMGLALLNFSITQGTNVCLVYVIDAYRPVAGEITLTVMGFKSLFGFFLSFETNPWINKVGYFDAYGEMAGISAAILVLWIPLYFYGKRIRHITWRWSVVSFIHWHEDREVGE